MHIKSEDSHRPSFAHCGMLVAVVIFLRLQGTAFGQDQWDNSAGGSYQLGTNWSLNLPPGAFSMGNEISDVAQFSLGTSGYTVTNVSGSLVELDVENDNPTFDLASGGLNFTGGIFVGNTSSASLTAVGPGTITMNVNTTNSTVQVGSASTPSSMTLNDVNLSQGLTTDNFDVTSGSTLTLENGSVVDQTEHATFDVDGNLVMNDSSFGASVTGQVRIQNGTISNNSKITSEAAILNGTVSLDNSQIDSQVTINGTLTLSDGALLGETYALPPADHANVAGTLDVLSGGTVVSYVGLTSSGVLEMQLAATMGSPQWFWITPNGTLDLTLQPGFSPSVGEQFDLFTPSTGTFSTIDLPSLPTGESWNTSELYSNGIISVVPEPGTFGCAIAVTALLMRRRRK